MDAKSLRGQSRALVPSGDCWSPGVRAIRLPLHQPRYGRACKGSAWLSSLPAPAALARWACADADPAHCVTARPAGGSGYNWCDRQASGRAHPGSLGYACGRLSRSSTPQVYERSGDTIPALA